MELQKLFLIGFYVVSGILLFLAGRAWQQNNIAWKIRLIKNEMRIDLLFTLSILLAGLCLAFFLILLFSPSSLFT